ncbi:MAG: hypothetical protein AUH78_25600 [Gemmatimonadetes bacterium 13_1_40CM_4_69_8]|nr:MAG: hypothetical protein AUH78_25600 [Gemmatimonadetes bacterium 13_1_40CM_4_69_8]
MGDVVSVGRQMSAGQPVTQSVHGRLVLTTFGAVSLSWTSPGSEPLPLLGPGKPLGLLIYLALSPARSASRDHLVDLLWADLDPEAARHALRQTMWFLHQRLGAEVVGSRNGEVTLCAPVESDRDAFVAAVEGVDFELASQLYRGDFLPGFAAPGGADFEHWADVERHRLRRLFVLTAHTAVLTRLARGRLREAKELAARVRDTSPHDESEWRLLLEALLAADDHAHAELEAAALERLLRDEGRPPEPATRAVLALVRRPAAREATQRRGLVAELIGRECEFATILEAWHAVRDGAGRHVRVIGAQGLGKTRLMGDAYLRLRAMGASAVRVRANPGERQIPYALASELAVALAQFPGAAGISPASAGALVALNPILSARYAAPPDRAADLEALRRREIALGELLAAVAEEQPVALLLDDLHWADGVSRQIVDSLLSRLRELNVLAVTSTRPGSDTPTPGTDAGVLTLQPLSRQQTGALVTSLGSLPDAPWAARLPAALCRATRGSPLLILETLRLALEQAWLTLRDGQWNCQDWEALSAELARGGPMRRWIEELGRSEGSLLLLLAVAGTPLSSDTLAAAADRTQEAVSAELCTLEVRGLVARDGADWRPAYDESGALALETASPQRVRAAHQALGHTLAHVAAADSALLHRAGQHFAAAEAESALQQVFARWIDAARRGGDRRRLRALARDLLSASPDAERVRTLVRSLPLRTRLGLTTHRRVAAAVGIALTPALVATALFVRDPQPPPDAALLVKERPAVDSPLPVDRPDLAAPVTAAASPGDIRLSWAPAALPSRYLVPHRESVGTKMRDRVDWSALEKER